MVLSKIYILIETQYMRKTEQIACFCYKKWKTKDTMAFQFRMKKPNWKRQIGYSVIYMKKFFTSFEDWMWISLHVTICPLT